MSKGNRKGILGIIFSRTALILALLLIQAYLIVGLYQWFEGSFHNYFVLQIIPSVLIVIYLANIDMDATGKLTWMVLIMVAPIPGSLLLLFTRKNSGQLHLQRRTQKLILETKNILEPNNNAFNDQDLVTSGTRELHHYLNSVGCFPIYDKNDVAFFPTGEQIFESLIKELKKAQSFIFMEFFIIAPGFMWDSILSILEEKSSQGVDVRIMFDGMCEITSLPKKFASELKNKGIKCKPFSPLTPFISTHYNYRDHRKILVIDGNVAYTGGFNLADEYINKINRFGHWKDCAIKVQGKAVDSFTLMFLQMWNISEKETDWSALMKKPTADFENASGYVMPYCDCPLDKYKVGEMVYCDILNRANSYVHIMTPYLILDDKIETALMFASERGVDVKIILPGIPDKKIAYSLAKSHYKTLLKRGVKIYEYTPGFVHSKIFVSDNSKAVVGTINLDYRSLAHHFECAAYLYKTDCIKDIENDFNRTLEKCRMVTPQTIKKEKLLYKVVGAAMKIIAPLL